MAILNNTHLRNKQNQKIIKYSDLKNQVKRQWKTITALIIISTAGAVPRNLLKKHELSEQPYKRMKKAM